MIVAKTLILYQRQRIIDKTRKEKDKEYKELLKAKENEYKSIKRQLENYPPTILTMAKRIKRISPWEGVVTLTPWDASLIIYYKLKQKGLSELRIICNKYHCWVEFKFSEIWYIFDVTAVKNIEYGNPIKTKSEGIHDHYTMLSTKYEDIDSFIEKNDDKLTFDKDEAKIYAMQDDGLNSVIKIIYH